MKTEPFDLKFCVLDSYRKLKEINPEIAYQFATSVAVIHKTYKKFMVALDKIIVREEFSHVRLRDKIIFFEERLKYYTSWAQASIEATFDLLFSSITKNEDTSIFAFIPIVQ